MVAFSDEKVVVFSSESIYHAFSITTVFSWAFIYKGKSFLRKFLFVIKRAFPPPPQETAAGPGDGKTCLL